MTLARFHRDGTKSTASRQVESAENMARIDAVRKGVDREAVFQERLAAVAHDIEALLDRLLAPLAVDGEHARPFRLLEAMRYSSLGGGKRLRPFLVVEFGRAVRRAARVLIDGRSSAGMRALLFAGARRSAGNGQRRPQAGAPDDAQGIRRGNRRARRRRASDLRLRHPCATADAPRCRGPAEAGWRARARRRARRHGRRPDARSRGRRPFRRVAARARRSGTSGPCRP